MSVVLAKREEEGSEHWKWWRGIRKRVRRIRGLVVRGLEVSGFDGERVTVVGNEENAYEREELSSSIGDAETGLI